MSTSKMSLEQQMIESGERERLKELLRQRLVEHGWKNNIRTRCKEIVKQRGVESITVEDLIAEVTPEARRTVPDEAKRELFQLIREFLAKRSGIDDL